MLFGIFCYWIAKQKEVNIKRMVIILSPPRYNNPAAGSLEYIRMVSDAIQRHKKFSVPDFSIYNNLGCGRDSLYSSGFRDRCSIAVPSGYWIRNKRCFRGLFKHYDMA